MSNHKSLVFFNKEGDYLNIKYNNTTDRFEGDLLFHESSSDIYKTFGIYMMEHLPAFEYAMPNEMLLDKFQLFNEWGTHFYGAKLGTFSMTSIEPINNDPGFYSKWIYGKDFERLFPIGTFIMFDTKFLEFMDIKKTYAVIGIKKDAIMILSEVDNATFESMYYNSYISKDYGDVIVRGANLVGIYNYIDSSYKNKLSDWNETTFYEKYYDGKRLNIVNSKKNDGIITIKDSEVTDAVHFEYDVKNIPTDKNLIIEVISKTDVPKIYDGAINIANGRIYFKNSSFFPRILKPGIEFKIVGSSTNTNFLSVSPITSFISTTNIKTYSVEDQVLYNNTIYQCKKEYTQDYSNTFTMYINPGQNAEYWGNPTYTKVDQSTTDESVNNAQIYLTTDRLYFEQEYTQDSSATIAMAVEKYKDDFKSLNIDLYTEKGILKADLMYSSRYAVVNFYQTETVDRCLASLGDKESFIIKKAIEIFSKPNDLSSTSSLTYDEYKYLSDLYDAEITICESYLIGNTIQTNERLVEVEDQLIQELNYDYSENYKYNIVFTDLDEFGLKVVINKHVYDEEINWIYSGAAPDMERTIDRTLRNWLTRHHLRLRELGIVAEVEYLGSYISPFFNSIIVRSEYPNIPIDITRVEVGTTADYHIEHSRVLFNSIGGNITFTINGATYETQTIYGTFLDNTGATVSSTSSTATVKLPDIAKTLETWVSDYAPILETYGIIATNINNLIKLDVKRTDRRFDYSIKNGKLLLPGQTDYIITKKIKGNKGTIITGNEIILNSAEPSYSFEDAGFGTGRVVSINNTKNPLQDVKYNLLSVDPKALNLSYQGPFWGSNSLPCKSSGFITLAFNLGFGQTTCDPIIPGGGQNGPFNMGQYNSDMFGISLNTNDYSSTNIAIGTQGVGNLIDLKYIQLSNSMFALGDNISIIDAYTGVYISTIYLTENGIDNSDSIKMEFNVYNNYLYCLSKNKVWVVDPVMCSILKTIALSNNAADIASNPDNGDIYITYTNHPIISIYDKDSSLKSTILTPANDTRTGKMVYNAFEKDMYVTTDAEILLRINGSSRDIQTSYHIPGLTQSSIFYEPVNESIYVYAQTQLWRIDNGITYSITGMTMSEFVDVIYNNLTGEMNVSDKTLRFRSLNLTDNTINIDKIPATYGNLALSQYDGGVYLASHTTKQILTIDSGTGAVIHIENTSVLNTKIVYNPERKSIWTLQPSINNIYEVQSIVNSEIEIIGLTGSIIEDSQYGTLHKDYVKPADTWIKALECVRRPRENFEGEATVKYYWRWFDDQSPEFFIYDLSGEQLEKTGAYAYLGETPLKDVPLNKYPNRDVDKVDLPEYQQTVFDRIEYDLSYINDKDDISTEPTPLQLFLGFKANEEGAYKSQLLLYKKEEVQFDIVSDPTNETTISFETLTSDGSKRGHIKLNMMSEETFAGRGLKVGQYLAIFIKDITNIKNQHISTNSGYVVKIAELYTKKIVVDFFSINDAFEDEKTIIADYPNTGSTTYLKTTFKVVDREIGRFNTLGQTDIEDPRFKIELSNLGKTIGPHEVFIFKDYDIYEGGIDWSFLNSKRKELLLNRHLIYPYIGSYKSIINAINFFGYNDLQLNEYYRNIDTRSENFSKLFKVEIPDIFDNTIEGWNDNDFIKHTFPNDNFEETNLMNLTYFVTDKEGNNILPYSIDEVTIKLQGLKFWLKKNIIPLTHKILDITGRSYFKSGSQITHRLHDMRIIDIKENMTPITFKLNEAYLMPVNSGSTVYNCVLDFYTIVDGIGSDKNPTGLIEPPRPYFEFKDRLRLPEYFNIKIRTYKTYKEWAAFTVYSKDDKVTYYGKLYISVIDHNKVKNPKRYDDVPEWNANITYETTSIVKYDSETFVYSGLGATYSSIPPLFDQGDDHNWLNITEWKEIDLEPVQTIDEYRRILPPPELGATQSIISFDDIDTKKPPMITPFNFAIDSNIDPFITIEITSENGYGSVYRDKKNYEIRGLKDLQEPPGELDAIGPFQPISLIY